MSLPSAFEDNATANGTTRSAESGEASDTARAAFLMLIEDFFTIPAGATCVVGTISHGHIRAGDEVEIVAPDRSKRKTLATHIERQGQLVDQADEGENICVVLRGVRERDTRIGYTLEKT